MPTETHSERVMWRRSLDGSRVWVFRCYLMESHNQTHGTRHPQKKEQEEEGEEEKKKEQKIIEVE